MSARPCHSCGALLVADARFCARCGTAVPLGPQESPPQFASPEPQARHPFGAPPPQPVVVELPSWVTTSWSYPLRAALGTLAIGLFAGAALSAVLVVAAALGSQLDPFPTKGALSFPLTAWLSFHGAVENDGLSMTGIAWILAATILARRLFVRGAKPHTGATPQQAVWTGAAKGAVVYAAALLAIAFVARAIMGDFGEIGYFAFAGARINPIAAFFLGAVAGFLGTLWMLAKDHGLSPGALLGLNIAVRLPESVRASLVGLRRILLIAIPSMAALLSIVFVIELGRFERSLGAAEVLSSALQALVLMALGGIDVGWGWFVYGTRFFLGDASVPNVLFSIRPRWIYVGIAIPVVAMLAGGVAAARSLTERTQQRAVEAGAFIALELMVFGLIAGLFWTRLGGGFVAASMFLPPLWAILAIGGAIMTVQGAVVAPAASPPPAWMQAQAPMQAATCPACGTPNAAGSTFCVRCGSRL